MAETATIDVSKWGRDHWSMFAYAAEMATHNKPLDGNRMRSKGRVSGIRAWRPEWGTRLGDGSVLEQHDDWDCAKDLATAGLIEYGRKKWHEVKERGGLHWVKLTDLGLEVWEQMVRYMHENDGQYSSFRWVPDADRT